MRANFVMSGVAIGIRRNLSMTIALVLSTAIALAFVGAAILANIEISRFRHNYEGKLNVSVFLCAKVHDAPCSHRTTPAETAALRQKLDSDPDVTSVAYVSEKEQYNRLKQIVPAKVAQQTRVGDLPASFTVKLKNIGKDYGRFAKTFGAVAGVAAVQNQISTIKRLLDVIDGARLFSIVIALVVLVASILLISNTIQVAAQQRRNETSIMRLVGASRWMTELPFMMETIIATALGGVIAYAMVAFGKHYVLNGIFQVQVDTGVIPNLTQNDLLIASGIGLIGGVVVSGLVALATLRLYVRL
jgi:cell division transport system permease protein